MGVGVEVVVGVMGGEIGGVGMMRGGVGGGGGVGSVGWGLVFVFGELGDFGVC